MGLRRFANSLLALLLLAVSSSAFPQAPKDLVGFWWKPSESGWGLSIQQQGNTTFAVWFTYDAQGAPVWYALTCAFTGSTCAGDLHTANGTPLTQITGGANLVAIRVGTAFLTATPDGRLNLTYTVGAVTQTKASLEPQNFGAANQVPRCSLQSLRGPGRRVGMTNFTDHWWGGADASGWGLQLSHQGTGLFGGWYSYNAQGTATWLTAQGTQDPVDPRRFSGALYAVNPGIPFSTISGPVPLSS
jgi:hypothetical protein